MLLTVITLTVVIGLTPAARQIDLLLMDQVQEYAEGSSRRPAVLLITLNEGAASERDVLEAIAAAIEGGALAVGIVDPPTVLRDHLLRSPHDRVLVAQLLENGGPVGTLPTADFGIYRTHQVDFVSSGNKVASLPWALALLAVPDIKQPASPFMINFMGPGRLPELSIEQALSGSLIPELVKGRVVLLGPGAQPDQARLATPVGDRHGAMSATRFQAYAVDSLVRDRMLLRMPLVFEIILFVVLCFLSVSVMARLGQRAYWMLAFGAIATLVASILSLISLNVVLPLTALVGAQLFSFVAVSLGRQTASNDALELLLGEYGQKLKDRNLHSNFLETTEHWEQVVNLVDQTLDLSRILFLEREGDAHRVHEVISRNCRLDDISEGRRDYDREPFLSAISARSPVKLRTPFLTAAEDEDQFLMALVFAGEVLGFWALSIKKDKHPERRQFVDAVHAFGDQVAELLYTRNNWQRHVEREERADPIQRAMREVRISQLTQAITASERRLQTFEDVFKSQSISMIVYDLFGQVIQLNRTMASVLADLDFPAYSRTALEFLVIVTGQSNDYCRGLLRLIVLGNQHITLPVRIAALDENNQNSESQEFQLTISPVGGDERAASDAEARPFALTGVMMELLDVSHLKRASGFKQDIIERLGFRLRGDAESIVLATSLLQDITLPEEMRAETLTMLRERAHSATSVIEEVREHLEQSDSHAIENAYPIDALALIQRYATDLTGSAASKRVTMQLNTPNIGSLVFAEVESLESLMTTILRLLIEDAAEDTVINIKVDETEEEQVIVLRNEGFGIPEARFQQYIGDEKSSSSPEFERLSEGLRQVLHWGGEYSCQSGVGKGFAFEIHLKIAI